MKVEKLGNLLKKIGLKGCKWFGLIAPGTESLEPIPVVDPIQPVPIPALYEANIIPVPKKMESQQR